MTKAEYAKLTKLTGQVDELLNAGPTKTNTILNIDVLEAFLGDVISIKNGGNAKEIPALCEQDKQARA